MAAKVAKLGSYAQNALRLSYRNLFVIQSTCKTVGKKVEICWDWVYILHLIILPTYDWQRQSGQNAQFTLVSDCFSLRERRKKSPNVLVCRFYSTIDMSSFLRCMILLYRMLAKHTWKSRNDGNMEYILLQVHWGHISRTLIANIWPYQGST